MNSTSTLKFFNYQLYDKTLLLLLLVSTFLFPVFIVDPVLPAFRIEDILLLPITLRLIQLKPTINFHIKLIAVFCLYIFFVIIINGRITCIRDYFEICKLIKLAVLILFMSLPQYVEFAKKLFLPVFIVLVIFNVFQYFNLFNFNSTIEKLYSQEHHLKYFGLYSDFTKASKRLLGTMGNPNNNGILFLFFVVQFIPLTKDTTLWKYLLYLTTVFICIHTQSRTAFIILSLIFIIHAYWQSTLIKKYKLIFIGFIVILFADFYSDNLLSLGSLRGTKVRLTDDMEFATNNHSLQTRFEIWKHLYGMIKEKPLLGYAPYKEYFYEHQLYSENEYILIVWRYGIIGLAFFMIMILYPAYKAYREKNTTNNIKLFAFTSCILLTALTNNPLSEPRVLVMYAIMAGIFYAETANKQTVLN
jgi:O-antigen ligase